MPDLALRWKVAKCSVVAKLGAFYFTLSCTPGTVARMIRRTASISAAHGWSKGAGSVSTSGFGLLAEPVTDRDVQGMESPEQVWRPGAWTWRRCIVSRSGDIRYYERAGR